MADPRLHRHVVAVDGDSIRYVCGCTNAVDAASGVLRSVSKCRSHRAEARDPATLDEAYYREMGVLDPEAPERYVGQLTEALGPLPDGKGRSIFGYGWPGIAVEIGCGLSPYCAALMARGWFYLGLDPSPRAVAWMQAHRSPYVIDDRFEDLHEQPHSGLVLAAHVFEHLEDAPGAIAKCSRIMAPGGELWAIVPDDEDPLNPDHMWFFDCDTLTRCVEAAGLEVVRTAVRRYIQRESFIYLRARKP